MFISRNRVATLLSRIRGKPAGIVARKAVQFADLWTHHCFGIWSFYERRAEQRWSPQRIARFVANAQNDAQSLISARGIRCAGDLLQTEPELLANARRFRHDVVGRRVTVFDQPVELPPWDDVDWRADWRFEHRWPDMFYRQYNFYEFDKPQAYDVKYPWELSRLNFLLLPTLLEVVEPSGQWLQVLTKILSSWRSGNPTACSVNWYPMECAMRSVNLALTTLTVAHSDQRELAAASLSQLLPLCELHGRFLFRTVEYTDVRGNHFAAEIAALMLLGLLLEEDVVEAKKWLRYGWQHLEKEILLQYCEDGVQFEKSISYHRLVTELFLLATIAGEKKGRRLGDVAKQRLRNACRYTASYTRPEGTAPIWGDSDDARALWLDTSGHANHTALQSLATVYYGDPSLDRTRQASVASPLLLEKDSPPSTSPTADVHSAHFPSGGMVCYRSGNHHFVADVGSVGLNGRGGHGHLDALSFELTLHGVPLIVDPGSFIYTGDAAARNRFRATKAHNVVMLDGVEMAEICPRQLWRLGNQADPYAVCWKAGKVGFDLEAKHDGYRRLADAVDYCRSWNFDARRACLQVQDRFECNAKHVVERFLHFTPELDFRFKHGQLVIRSPQDAGYVVTCNPETELELIDDWVSPSYGQRTASKTLVMRNLIAKTCRLDFSVAPLS